MKTLTTSARLAKISRLATKIANQRALLDMERASAEHRASLHGLRRHLQQLSASFEPHDGA